MKTKTNITIALLLALAGNVVRAELLGTAFTYQGKLTDGGLPAHGLYDFRFALYDAPSSGNPVGPLLATDAVPVTNGLFTVELDFGAEPFTGEARWLQVSVRSNGLAKFTALSPLQAVTPTPTALWAATAQVASNLVGQVAASALAGAYTNALAFSHPANSFTGNGAGLTALNASQLASGTVPDARLAANVARTNQVWLLGGNAATTPSTHFVGTTDNQPLELKVNNQRGLRLEPAGSNSVNIIGGWVGNGVATGVIGATVGGGGAGNYWGQAYSNRVDGDFGTVAGGACNLIIGNAAYGTIPGGWSNTIQQALFAAIGGGRNNLILSQGWDATIGGGDSNTNGGPHATIGGGWRNSLYGDYSTVGGGVNNMIPYRTECATIGGGDVNKMGIEADAATIAGGAYNTIQDWAGISTIGGGLLNIIQTSAGCASIGGGYLNIIHSNATYATIGGGRENRILTNASLATVSGGWGNQATNISATVGGGFANLAGGLDSTVPGGNNNTANGNYSFAAGRRAKANHVGTFVWADSTDADFASTAPDQFLIRATGGVGIGGPPANALLDVKGDVRLNDTDLRLRGGSDVYQGLGWYGSGKTFAGLVPDGPVIYGWAGGVLGTHRGGQRAVLQWDDGKVGIGRTPTANAFEVEGNASKTTAGSWLANSDARIKQDIVTVTNALETLSKVRLVSFRYTDAYRAAHRDVEDRRYLNVVAQEFAEVFPDAVKSSGEKLPDGSEILQVDTYPLTIYSAAAVQELSRRLDEERAANAGLRERLARLEQLVQQLIN